MQLDLLDGVFAVARLPADAATPNWAHAGDLLSITRTREELSIVRGDVPDSVECQRGWRCLKVRGPLDFSLTGVLASLAVPLADAGVPIFVLSTFNTDYVLIPEASVQTATAALVRAGHTLQ